MSDPEPSRRPSNGCEMVQTRTRRTMLPSALTAVLTLLLVAAGFSDAEEETRDHLMEKFLSTYAGLFHNQRMHDADPSGVLFASKHHIPVTNEFLCPSGGPGTEKYCFYVNEKTKRGGSMQYRLRMAVITMKRQGKEEWAEDGGTGDGASPVVFTAAHYQFADQASLEELPEEECVRRASKMDGSQLSLVPGGSVDFHILPGGGGYKVETAYDTCSAHKGGDSGEPAKAAGKGDVKTDISGTLTAQGWDVTAVGTLVASGKEIFNNHVLLDRAGEGSPASVVA